MAEHSGAERGAPRVYRTVAASTTLASGVGTVDAPLRNASFLLFMNPTATAATAVFTGPDDEDVTVSVPAQGSIPLDGNFKTVGALGTGVTCVAGWIPLGT
jgi:hypothetical protein